MRILTTLSNPFTHDVRVYNEAQSLVKAGHEVTVFCWDRKQKHPQQEEKDGIHVIRSFNSSFMSILPKDIFRLHWWWRKGFKDINTLWKTSPFDVVHCHNLDTLPLGVKLKQRFHIPLIYDAHEIWGYMVEKDLPSWWAKYYLKKDKQLVQHVDHIITVNDPLQQYFQGFTGTPITQVMNCKPVKKSTYKPPTNNMFTILYIGMLAPSRCITELIDIIGSITKVQFLIGGMGSSSYEQQITKHCKNHNNTKFLGKIPSDQVLPMTKESHLVVCMFHPTDRNMEVGLPNKVFEAAASGRPILVTKGSYYEQFVVTQGKFGVSADYDNDDIKKTIEDLRDHPQTCEQLGKQGLKAAQTKYNWDAQERNLLKVYEGIST